MSATVSAGWVAAESQARELLSLGDNWEEGAVATNVRALHISLLLMARLRNLGLPPPTRMVPTWDGHVVIEWQGDGTYTQVEVTATGELEWMHRSRDSRFHHSNSTEWLGR